MCLIFFFNDTATTDIYTLSLHDALPIFFEEVGGYGVAEHVGGDEEGVGGGGAAVAGDAVVAEEGFDVVDRKSTRLNSSHSQISYAVFCLKKKKVINEFLLITGRTV